MFEMDGEMDKKKNKKMKKKEKLEGMKKEMDIVSIDDYLPYNSCGVCCIDKPVIYRQYHRSLRAAQW